MGINDNYVKALTKMASDPKNQEAYRQRVATIQADMQRVREQEVLADFNQWKTDNGVVDVPQPKAPVMKSVDELRKPTQTREYNKKLANDQRIKETLARKQINVAPYRKNYGNINVSKRERQQNKDGSYSTILGASNAFAGNNGEYEVSYSPFLQTGTGTPEKLDDSTMQTYINSVLREAEKKPGGATEKNILAVDKQGYNVNGKQISGMIAGAAKYGANGENDPNVQRVIRSAEEMHYAGEYYDKLADSAKAKDIVMKQNKGRDEYVRRQQVKEATMKQNKGRDEYILNQQKLEAATPVTTPEQTKQTPVSNYLTGNSAPNNSFYNNTGVSVSRTADKKAKAVQQESVLVKDMKNAAEVDGVVNQWLAKDKLTGAEKKQAQKIYQQKKHALDLASSDWYRTMSTADATKKYNEELQKIEPLNLKSRGSMPFNYGLFKGLGTNSILKAEGDLLSKVTGDEGYKDAFNGVDTLSNMAQEENNVAYGAGNLTGELLKNAAEYGVANEVIGASRLGQAINNGAKKLPGGRFFGDAYANLATGQLADTLIDTPRTIAYNARDGKYIDENGNVDMGKVLADIGINQAVNLGFNAAFGIGDVVQGVKNKKAYQKASQKAFRDLLDKTTRNTPEAVAREEADLLTQARQYGKARQIAEANNAKVQLQTPEATAKEEAELLAQARAMGEERAKASKQFDKVKESVLKDFDPNSNRSWQKTINKLSEYRKKYGDSANEDIMSFARDLESYSKGIEGTEVEKVLGPRRTVNVTERPRKFNGDMRTSEDFARNSTYIAEPLQREGMREAIGEDLYNRLEKSYVNWMDEYFRMDKTAGAANELELRAKYLEDTLDDVAKVTGDDFSNIKNAIRQNNELAIADNYGTTKFVTDYKGDHAGTKAKEPGYQFSDLTEEESELVDRSLRSARSAVGELDNRVREIQNRYNDWTKSGYGGNTYNPVSDTLAAQLDELKSSYNIYADAIADPAHEGLGYAKRALIRDLEKTRKLVNEEGKFNVNFGKQLTMDINGAEKAIYGHKIGDVINNNPSHFSKNLVDSEGKLAHNEGIKEKTDYGNGGIIKETGTEETVRRSGLQNNETLGNDSGAYGRDSVGPEGAEIYPGLPRGRRQGSGDSTVSTGVVVRDNVRKAMDEQGVSNMGLKDSSGNYSRYSEALSSARKANEYGAFVDSKTVDELTERGAKAYLNDEGTAGVAVMNDGNIVGVFKHPSDTRKGASTDLIITARENGGDRLDCYGAKLVRKYSEGGFEPVARVKYEYGINPEMDSYMKLKKSENPNFKEPEIYFMKVRDGESVEDSLKALSNGSSPVYTPKQLSELPLMDYEAAEAYRDSLIEQAKQSSANNTAFSMRKNNADRLATDVKSFANRTELKKPSTEDLTVKPGPKAKVKGKLPDELNKGSDNARKAIKEKLAPEGDFKEYSVSKDIRTDKISTAPEVKAMFADQPQMYKVVHNKDIDAEAEKLFKESDSLEDARSICEGLASEHDATAIPLAKRLIDEYASKGEYQAAADVYDMLESKGNISGRFIQAFNMLMLKDNPIVAQKRLEKSIAKINLDGAKKFGKKWKNLSLTDDELAAFKQIKKGDREALGKLYDEIGERFGQEYPATLTEKILEYRRLAMLSGTTTHIRNFLANPPTMVLRHFADRYEALGQNIAHLINPDVKVTQSKLLPRHKDYALARQIRRESPIAKELFGNDTTGKYEVDELRNALIKNRTIYKGFHVKPGSKLEGTAFDTILKKKSELLNKANKKLYGKQGESVGELARNTIYGLLSKEDAPMVKANFDDRLASYIKAQNITSAQDIPEDAIALAWQEAMMATYKDDSWAVKALEGVRNGMKKIPVLGEPLAQTAIPFVQAPANITARVLDYSPLGGTAGMGRIIKGVRSNNVDLVSKGISQLAKGMSGTSAIALGTILAKSGIVTGAYSENKRMREAQQQSGWQEFSFKIGDKYYPYDWAQPWAQSVMMGVILNDTVNDLESYDSELLKALGVEGSAAGKAIGAVSKGGFEIANSVLEQSSVKGIRDLLASNQYGSNTEMAQGIAKQMGTNFAGSFIPTEVSKIAKTVDPLKRNANDKTNAYKAFGKAQQAKIPELSKKLPIKYDTWGRPQKYGEGKLDTFLNQNLYPGVPSKDRKTPVEEMTFELFNKTNDENVFAKLAPTKVDGETLNNVQVSKIQKEMGQTSYKMADLLRNNGTFKSLKDSSKVEALNSAYGFAQMLAEKKILNRAITTNHNTAYKVYEEAGGGEAGLHAVVKLYAENEVLREAGVTANEKNRELYRKEGINAVKKLGAQSTAIENAGFEATEANRKLFEKGGKKALQDKQAYEDALEKTGWKEKKKSSEEEEKENKKRTIYNERGEEGLSIYKSVDNAVDKRNKDTTQAAEAALNYLDKQKMSKADKGYYIAKSMGKPGKAAEAYIKKGDYEGLYEYEHHKYSADADGNNRLTKQEVEEYLNGQNMTNQQRLVWFDQLMPKSKKNPYK